MSDIPVSRREYPGRPFVAASVAVYRDGRFLLASRTRPPYAHIYSLPGGMVETGETLEETAIRELMEEVGVKTHALRFVGPLEVIDRDEQGNIRHHVVIMVHVGLWKSGEPQTGPEAQDVYWANLDEMDHLPLTPHLKEVLVQAERLLSGNGQ